MTVIYIEENGKRIFLTRVAIFAINLGILRDLVAFFRILSKNITNFMIDGIFDNGSEPGELETVDNQEPAIFFQEKEEYNISLANGVSIWPTQHYKASLDKRLV